MRKIVLGLAVSLDGYIEGPNGEIDWCFTDQDYGMSSFFERIDTVFTGRRSYELMLRMGETATSGFPRMKEFVFSNTLTEIQGDRFLVRGDLAQAVESIRREPGKDIWLFGGSSLISSFMNAGYVDEYWLSVHPVILGGGKPLLAAVRDRIHLRLLEAKSFPSGLVSLKYAPK